MHKTLAKRSKGLVAMEIRYAGYGSRVRADDSALKRGLRLARLAGVAGTDKVITFSTRGLIQILSFNLAGSLLEGHVPPPGQKAAPRRR